MLQSRSDSCYTVNVETLAASLERKVIRQPNYQGTSMLLLNKWRYRELKYVECVWLLTDCVSAVQIKRPGLPPFDSSLMIPGRATSQFGLIYCHPSGRSIFTPFVTAVSAKKRRSLVTKKLILSNEELRLNSMIELPGFNESGISGW